jgi:hypothetical protein
VRVESLSEACAQVVGVLARRCARTGSHDDPKPRRGDSTPPPASKAAPEVKRVECLFTGHEPQKEFEEIDDYVQRNMSFANGVFTVHNDPRLVNIDWNVGYVIKPQAVGASSRKNGASCTTRSNCSSFACVKGVCQPCGPHVACASGATCNRSNGVCYSNEALDGIDRGPSPPSPSPSKSDDKPKKKLKGLGEMCKSSAECRSDLKCVAANGTRSNCR